MRNKNYLQQPQDQNLRSTGKKSYLKGQAATKCVRECGEIFSSVALRM